MQNNNIEKANIFQLISIYLLVVTAACLGWGTYLQFGPGLTYATLPIGLGFLSLLFSFLLRLTYPKITKGDFLIIGLYIVAFFSQIWSLKPEAWLGQFFWYSACIIVYFNVRFNITSYTKVKILNYGIIIGLLVTSTLITQQQNQYGLIEDRQSVDNLNSNFVAYVLAGSLFILNISYKLNLYRKWTVWFFIILNIFIFYKIYLLGTRGAIISVLGVWLWLTLFDFLPKKVVIFFISTIAIIALLASFGAFNSLLPLLENLFSVDRSTGDLSGRLPSWSVARSYIVNHFVLGVGVGAFPLLNSYGIGAHNFFLTFMLELGFIGFFLFLSFLFSMFKPLLIKNANRSQLLIFSSFFIYWLPIATSGHWELSPFSWLLLALTYNFIRLCEARL